MRSFLLFLLLLMGVYSCAPTKYFVKSETDLASVNWEFNQLNYIPLKDVEIESSRVLDSTYTLLNLRKFSKLKSYLSSKSSMSSDVYLAWALYYVSKANYQKAFFNVAKIEDGEYEFLKQLLLTDLRYEFLLTNSKNEYPNTLKKYQLLLDQFSTDPYVKEIVALRSRYLRYSL